MITHPRPLLTAAIVIAVVACGDSAVEPNTEPASLQAVTQLSIDGMVATAVDPPPTVVVKDAAGNPVPGIPVEFAVGAGGGSVSSKFVNTDWAGLASVTWTLGNYANPPQSLNQLWAQVPGLAPIRFTARARAAPPALILGLAKASDTLAGGLGIRIGVRVFDTFGNSLPDVAVTFKVTSGDGSVAAGPSMTGSAGTAYTDWTLGVAGENLVTASVAGVKSVDIRMIALDPATFVWYDLESITGSSESVESAVVGFDASGRFVFQTVWPAGWRYSGIGRYRITGSTVFLNYPMYSETGEIDNDQLVIYRPSDYYDTTIWTYKKRTASVTK